MTVHTIEAGHPTPGTPYERQDHRDPRVAPDRSAAHLGIAVLVRRVLRLQREISVLAGDVAVAEEHVSLAYRKLADQDPERAREYVAAAVEAERYAEHKREEQRRWRLT